MPVNAVLLNPFQNGHAGELSAIVRHYSLWKPSQFNCLIQLRSYAKTGNGCVSNQSNTFLCIVTDNRQNAKSPAISECIRYKIQTPTLVRAIRHLLRLLVPKARFLPPLRRYLQLFFSIYASQRSAGQTIHWIVFLFRLQCGSSGCPRVAA